MIHSVSVIRSHFMKVVKENERRLVNKLLLLQSEYRGCQLVKERNRSTDVKCLGELLLANLSIHPQSKVCGSRLLEVHSVIITPVHHFTTTTTVNRSNTLTTPELKKAIEKLTEQFMEARELLDDARESMGTVYFSEDMDEARNAVVTTLAQYQNLLTLLSENQKQEVLRTIGLKMEELKAQEQTIKE